MEREHFPNHLIAQLHQGIWEATRNWERNIVQYIAVLITVIAIIGYAFYNIEERSYLIFPATIISQLALLWMLFVNAEAAYQYRSFQALSIKIEKEFAESEFKKILPESYRKIKYGLPDIYRIHFWAFFFLLTILSIGWIHFVLKWNQKWWKYIVILAIYILVLARYFYFVYCQRKKKFIKNFPESQTRS